jgi:hypothetical protein
MSAAEKPSGGTVVLPAQQVKEKFGTLRFYVAASPRGQGALDLAEEMSARVCEETGRQGRLGRLRGYYMTRGGHEAQGRPYGERWVRHVQRDAGRNLCQGHRC